mmetsp:Transcript_8244/g.33361  ORF Transcript_8244/g.33361 Transcript_8244/m.33361 type:complete len:243 (-) Transcript_8244:781-1509(-)
MMVGRYCSIASPQPSAIAPSVRMHASWARQSGSAMRASSAGMSSGRSWPRKVVLSTSSELAELLRRFHSPMPSKSSSLPSNSSCSPPSVPSPQPGMSGMPPAPCAPASPKPLARPPAWKGFSSEASLPVRPVPASSASAAMRSSSSSAYAMFLSSTGTSRGATRHSTADSTSASQNAAQNSELSSATLSSPSWLAKSMISMTSDMCGSSTCGASVTSWVSPALTSPRTSESGDCRSPTTPRR